MDTIKYTQAVLDTCRPGEPFRQCIKPGQMVSFKASDGTVFQVFWNPAPASPNEAVTLAIYKASGSVTAEWDSDGPAGEAH